MTFLTQEDLQTVMYQQFMTQDGAANVSDIINNIENQNIALIKSKLNGKFNTVSIFSATGGDRHWLIIKILVRLVMYDFIRRNAARKVAQDLTQDWEWAMKMLESIKAGKEVPDGLPLQTDEDGNVPNITYGNNKNTDFYI